MHRQLLVVWSIVAAIAQACQPPSQHQTGEEIQAGPIKEETKAIHLVRSDEPLTIDGELSEDIWSNSQKIPLKNNITGNPISDPLYHSYAIAAHDSSNLYIAFVNMDQNIHTSFTKKDEFLWQDEVVEVFIDGDPDISTYIELEVSPTNVVFDSYIVDTLDIDLIETPLYDIEGLQTAVKVDGTVNDSTDVDKSWTVEVLIPLEALTMKREDGQVLLDQYRINFFRINRDSHGPNYYAWSPTFARFHAPTKFGSIVLDH